jgi:hypothetical protein
MPVSMGTHPRYLEELRLGGGYNSLPDGGADLDASGNIQTAGGLDLDGDGAVGGNLAVTGDLDVTGLDTGWRLYMPANLGIPDPSLPCGPVTTTNWRNFQVATPSLAFDPTNPEAAFFQFRLPKSYDGRPLKFTLEWSALAGTSGDVRWGVNPLSFSDSDTLVETGTLYYDTDTFLATSIYHSTFMEVDAFSGGAGVLVTLRVLRDSGSGLDTFDSDVLLLGVAVEI